MLGVLIFLCTIKLIMVLFLKKKMVYSILSAGSKATFWLMRCSNGNGNFCIRATMAVEVF